MRQRKGGFVFIIGLILALLFSLSLAEGSQELFNEGDFEYRILQDGTAEITKYRGEAANLAIPDNVNGTTVSTIGARAFFGCRSIQTLTLPDGLTAIGDRAFGRTSIIEVEIPAHVRQMGSNPFDSVRTLMRIGVHPDNTAFESVDGTLFSKEDKRLISYPIGRRETEYTVPQGTQVIGKNGFYLCQNLQNITLPEGLISVEDFAFSGTGIEKIFLPNSLITIGTDAFYGTNLQAVDIPAGVLNIGFNPFGGSQLLTQIRVHSDNAAFESVDGVLFSKEEKRLICYPLGRTDKDYTLPQGTKIIGQSAFSGSEHLQNIYAPEGLTGIESWACAYCPFLKNITLPNSVNMIGAWAFSDCENLERMIVEGREVGAVKNSAPEPIKPDAAAAFDDSMRVGEGAFFSCSSLQSVDLPNGILYLGDGLFENCKNLKSVTLPNRLIAVGDRTFYACHNLQSIDLPDSVITIGKEAFSYCSGLKTITIQEGTERNDALEEDKRLQNAAIPSEQANIVERAFNGCVNLESVALPNGVTAIAAQAFMNCDTLQNLTLPKNITVIGDRAFNGCANLLPPTFPNSLKKIGAEAFRFCQGFQSLTLPEGLLSIGDGAFADCNNLQTIDIPLSVQKIGANPFELCDNLIHVGVHPDSAALEVIDGQLFTKEDKRLVWIPIPQDVTWYTVPEGTLSIGAKALADCDNIISVTLPDSVIRIADGAFADCYWLREVYIPASVKEIGANPFMGCPHLNEVTIHPGNTALEIIDGALFSKADKRLVWHPEIRQNSNYTIPQGTKVIGNSAFYRCSNIQSIFFPNDLTSIEDGAFSYCVNLQSLIIPQSVEHIGAEAFSNCRSLQEVVLPSGLESIENRVFYDCESLQVITLPESLTAVGESAFSYCKNLQSISIPASVNKIGQCAFDCCENLKTVTIFGSKTDIGLEVFYGCNRLEAIFAPLSSFAQDYCNVNGLPFQELLR